ncbi:hypothetical protein PALI_a3770 [Pseudoalteromonas aliena SW19]|uniref:Uncharacterized protein n=1 Tax=Pseudoalteromonas aliena SW19 TaxID=1314866 RepID=A0ABR9DUL1_9GAMM|nr:hypothetical protein [Pseudoalteromonas aliena SW19]
MHSLCIENHKNKYESISKAFTCALKSITLTLFDNQTSTIQIALSFLMANK